MNDRPQSEDKTDAEEFARQAENGQVGFFAEFWDFLLHNKKWWITPIMIVLLLLSVFAMLGGTAFAPFIYTLF